MTPKLQRTTINRQIDFCHWAAPAYLFAAANPCEAFQPGSEMEENGSRPDVRDAKKRSGIRPQPHRSDGRQVTSKQTPSKATQRVGQGTESPHIPSA